MTTFLRYLGGITLMAVQALGRGCARRTARASWSCRSTAWA